MSASFDAKKNSLKFFCHFQKQSSVPVCCSHTIILYRRQKQITIINCILFVYIQHMYCDYVHYTDIVSQRLCIFCVIPIKRGKRKVNYQLEFNVLSTAQVYLRMTKSSQRRKMEKMKENHVHFCLPPYSVPSCSSSFVDERFSKHSVFLLLLGFVFFLYTYLFRLKTGIGYLLNRPS